MFEARHELFPSELLYYCSVSEFFPKPFVELMILNDLSLSLERRLATTYRNTQRKQQSMT